MLPAIITLGVLTTIAFLIVRVTKGGLPAMYCKAGASVCFIGTAFAAFSYSRDNFEYGVLMIMGFIFSLLGDIWLDLKYVYHKDRDIFLYSGFICFLVGHLFFIPAIFREFPQFSLKYLIIGAVICAVVSVGNLLLEKPMKLNYGRFRVIVGLYTFFLSMTMVTSVIGMITSGFSNKFILLTVGSVAFTLSDLVLSSIYFKEGGNTKVNVIVNHLFYYFAQFALAATLLF